MAAREFLMQDGVFAVARARIRHEAALLADEAVHDRFVEVVLLRRRGQPLALRQRRADKRGSAGCESTLPRARARLQVLLYGVALRRETAGGSDWS